MSHNSPMKERDVVMVADLSLTWSAGGLPGQDDLLREEAGDGAGLLYHQQVYRAGSPQLGLRLGIVWGWCWRLETRLGE
jgi:hypothetical protein